MTPSLPVIEAIELFDLQLPLKIPFAISYGSYTTVDSVLVKMTASDGSEGWGEATPDEQVTGETCQSVFAAMRDVLGPPLLGQDPRNRTAIHGLMDSQISDAPTAKAAMDIALHDLVARMYGIPLWALLGGRTQESLKVSRVVSLASPKSMAEAALTHVNAGFSTIKLKVGEPDNITLDVERILAVRKAVGPTVGIKIDVNQGWQFVDAATDAIHASLSANPLYYEQPIAAHDREGMAALRRNTEALLMVDEGCHDPQDAMSVVCGQACDLINIKLMKCGGLLAAVDIASIASAAGIACQIGTMVESSIASAAGLHFAMSHANVSMVEMGGPIMLKEDIGSVGHWYQTETVHVPDLPGLGFTPDERRIRSLSQNQICLDA